MTTIPSPFPHLPSSYHPRPAGTPSFRQDGCPSSGHTGGLWRVTIQPCSEGAGVCLRPTWPRGSPLIFCVIPSQTKGNSGSSLILMKDDAWQASVLSQHQGSCRGGRGCSGAWSLPVTGFLPPPGTVELSGSPCSSSDLRGLRWYPLLASVSPPLPLRVRSPGDLDMNSVLQSRQER